MIGWTKNLAVALFPVMTLVVSFGAAGTAEATQGCAGSDMPITADAAIPVISNIQMVAALTEVAPVQDRANEIAFGVIQMWFETAND